MSSTPTNRDLYLGIQALMERHDGSRRSLEEFLRALWSIVRIEFRDRPSISVDGLLGVLDRAWTAPAPPFDDAWRALPGELGEAPMDFGTWEGVILRQIRDLREMEEAGLMENEYRYFGMDSPRGGRWYNYDPFSYLEGAVAGTFGGWAPEDGTRMVVPGPVAVIGEDGELTTADPSEIDEDIEEIPAIPWRDFTRFLECGQWYE